MKKLALALALSLFAFSAFAQRTFVSGSGSDLNPCSVSQPCRTMQQALNAVASGGEIVVLDSASYGTSLSINKSVNIINPTGIYGVISGPITVNAGGTDIIRIKGLDVLGTTTASGTGVDIGNCKRTELERMRISKMYVGVKVSADVKAYLDDVTITDVTFGVWSVGTGTVSQPMGVGPPLKVTLEHTRVIGCQVGLKVDAGSFYATNGDVVAYATTDAYLIAGIVSNCSQISLQVNSGGGNQYYNNFTALQADSRNGMQNNGNCNAN
jgi:hypothetical protein